VTAPLDLERLAGRDDPIGLLLRSLDSLAADPAALQSLAEAVLADLGQKLPPDLRGADGVWALDADAALADALASARERLLAVIGAEDTR